MLRLYLTETSRLSLNLYTYCQNNPIVYIDPSGNYYIVRKGNGYKLVKSDWKSNIIKPAANLVPFFGTMICKGIDETYGEVVGGNSMSDDGAVRALWLGFDILEPKGT